VSERYTIGPFVLDVERFALSRDGVALPIQPKVLELLVLLVRRRGELVDNTEIQSALWPGVRVSENSRPQVVHKLREMLGEHASLVETVPRKGLRIRSDAVPAALAPRWPAERDRFVGRDQELAALSASDARLRTVVGPGGIGKSRLVLRWLASSGVDATYVDVDEVRTVDGLLDQVADALGRRSDRARRVEDIGRMLALCGRSLLVLDGFDALIPWAEETVGGWLDRGPELRIVVTSRQLLSVRGESVLPLGPLPDDDAAALFAERARAAQPTFAASDEGVRQLVDLLDHHPLAIELTASRVRALSVDELRARLVDRQQLLSVRSGRLDRHATLRTVLDFDWERLAPETRAAIARLSVFQGGFTAEAAERVIGTADALEELGAVIDRSWVAPDRGRFSMLSLVQAYAAEKLAEMGPAEVLEAQRRHGRWAASLDQPGRFPGHASPVAALLQREHPNLVAAAQRAAARGDLETAVSAASAATLVRRGRGDPLVDLVFELLASPMPRRLRTYLALATSRTSGRPRVAAGLRPHLLELLEGDPQEVDDTTRARLEYALSELDRMGGRPAEALQRATRAVGLARAAGEPATELAALALRVTFMPAELQADIARGLALARELGDGVWEQGLLSTLGNWHVRGGELTQAQRAYEQAVQVHGGPVAEGVARLNLASVLSDRGQFDPSAFEAALQCFDQGPWFYEACAHANFADALVDAGRPEAARAHAEAALTLFDPDDARLVRWARLVRARLHAALGDLGAARADHALAARVPSPDARLYLVGAELRAREAQWPAALDEARQAEAAARQAGSPLEVGRSLVWRARAERSLGLEAGLALAELRHIVERGGLGPQAWLSRELAAIA
jgi:predicted ATPase/DNA-binding winged helix-turn-helix (wHTH) protein